jgi:DNA recombination protein RmuC
MPDNRQVIIDSKVSLTAWDKFVNAEDEEESEAAMKEHVASVNNHVKTLAKKNYQDIEQVNTVDFVLMFVPLEPAFGAAMRIRPDLYQEFAENNRVKVVTGGTIVIALMLIQDIWKRERQSGNQVKLIDEAGKLHDKIVLFLDSFKQLGHEIGQASVAYDEAMSRLSVGPGNVIKRTNDLKLLGAKVKKEIDTQLLTEGQVNHDMAGESSD